MDTEGHLLTCYVLTMVEKVCKLQLIGCRATGSELDPKQIEMAGLRFFADWLSVWAQSSVLKSCGLTL